MSGLPKDNAGYDLPALLVGTEGTLAVITGARLRLVPRLPERATVLIGLESLAAAVGLLRILRAEVTSLEAVDFFLDAGLELVLRHRRLPPPLSSRAPVYVIVECAGRTDPLGPLAEAVEHVSGVVDVAAADDTARREALWRYREEHPEAILAEGIPHKLDVGIPVLRLAEFEQRLGDLLRATAPAARAILFGHLGDGNVHVNILDLPPDTPVEDAALHLVSELGGTVSAEHGIGVAKTPWLGLTRSPSEISAMRAIKCALDPRGVLNPGVVLGRPASSTVS
jgi:FAD/FMN-containing dehydrogenase